MSRSKRLGSLLSALTLTVALAVALASGTAGAASWRPYGSARADGQPAWTTVAGRANRVTEIQFGFTSFGEGTELQISWHTICNDRLRSGERIIATTPGIVRWFTFTKLDTKRNCDFYLFARGEDASHKTKVRVR
jgi:hypothetical protein